MSDDEDLSLSRGDDQQEQGDLSTASASLVDLHSLAAYGELLSLQSAAHTAAHSAQQALQQLLNHADEQGMTLMHSAAGNGRLLVVEWLLREGADPRSADVSGLTALHYSAGYGSEEVVRTLLASPAGKTTINTQDNQGRTALHWASHNAHDSVVAALIGAGADTTIKDNQQQPSIKWLSAFKPGNQVSSVHQHIPVPLPVHQPEPGLSLTSRASSTLSDESSGDEELQEELSHYAGAVD